MRVYHTPVFQCFINLDAQTTPEANDRMRIKYRPGGVSDNCNGKVCSPGKNECLFLRICRPLMSVTVSSPSNASLMCSCNIASPVVGLG